MFLSYSFFGAVYPIARFSALVIGIALLPWIVVRSLGFNAHNTLYRGMRLRFRSGLTEACVVYLVLPLLIFCTLGLYYPAWQRRKQAFMMNNHRYGDAFFSFHAGAGGFYRAIIFGALIVFAGAALMGTIIAVWTTTHAGTPPSQTFILTITVLIYGSAFFTGRHYTQPRIFNHIWNHTQLDDHQFVAQMSPGAWMKLQWTNQLAIIFTCGLALPWATIRNTRFMMESLPLNLTAPDSLENVDTMGSVQGSALGDSAADFVGVDFGL